MERKHAAVMSAGGGHHQAGPEWQERYASLGSESPLLTCSL